MPGDRAKSDHLDNLLKRPIAPLLCKKVQNSAKDQPCWLRFEGCTNDDTVVFAHFRDIQLGAGIGKKPSIWGCPACHGCHSEVDRRTRALEYDFVRKVHAESTLRYVEHLRAIGVININEGSY